ncbi:uncharacterized protein ColSpa_08825 [Colletotrichum spaethianum]|uniref:Myb-like domain-containing protein n=1 Tax=Colletotrichum spaethianum TaxID=700344 RepID=A0AA37UIV2_9PEZI|nr:uncharacterized protein ColSpa_08825 [Colletotrichum spaethianum]GKT48644.1 hypothetical protein ColSpa_08825 [Colletotrichum spaethianum]
MADAKGSASTSLNATEGAPAGGRVGAWTDTERFQLVLRVLATHLPDGKGVDWKSINMPNRTLKAMQGQWTSITAMMREINAGDGGDASTPKAKTPRKKAAPKKKAAATETSENDNEDIGDDQNDGENKKTVTPKKRAAATDADGTPKKRRSPAKKSALKAEPELEAGTEDTDLKEDNGV